MKGGNDRIELIGNQAHCGRGDRAPEDRQQSFADLAHRKPENKARQDLAVDLLAKPGIGANHRNRGEPLGTGTASSMSPSSVSRWRW